MSADYRVDLTIGPTVAGVTYTWSINRGDAPSLPEVLDGLSLGWQFAPSNLWPAQPDPVTLTLSLIAEAAADLAGIDRGTPLVLRIWAGATLDVIDYDSVTFTGNVSDVAGHPVTFGHPVTEEEVDGWQVDLIAVDPVAPLGEFTLAGTLNVAGLDVQGRIDAYLGAAMSGALPVDPLGAGILDWSDGGGGTGLVMLNDGVLEPTDLLTVLDQILTGYADGGVVTGDPDDPNNYALYASQGWRRGILRPNSDPAGVIDPDTPYRVEWVSRRYGVAPGIGPVLPAVFKNLGAGLYGPQLEAPPASVVIGGTPVDIYDASIVVDAGYLDIGATWTRTKFDAPNVVEVANGTPPELMTDPWSKVTATNRLDGEAVVSASVPDCLLEAPYSAANVAEMYLDDSLNADVVWSATGFRWYASQDPQWPVLRSLFPDTELFGEYGAPIVITGIPAAQRPDDRPWYVGVPRAVQWTFNQGDFDIAFDLDPRTPKPINDGAVGLTWADLATDFPAVTWNNLDPAYTWLDYRLIRSAIYYP